MILANKICPRCLNNNWIKFNSEKYFCKSNNLCCLTEENNIIELCVADYCIQWLNDYCLIFEYFKYNKNKIKIPKLEYNISIDKLKTLLIFS